MTCSHLPASAWASAHDRPNMSVRKRSARRWRRTTRSASSIPLALRVMVSPTFTSPSDSIRRIISDTAGRETSSRSAMRAWITPMSSSRSSQMASQYSSKAGWNSFERVLDTAGVYVCAPTRCPARSGSTGGAGPVSERVATLARWTPLRSNRSRRRFAPGSRRRSRSRHRPRAAPGAPSPGASTRCCAHPPGRARRSLPSSGRSIVWGRRRRSTPVFG